MKSFFTSFLFIACMHICTAQSFPNIETYDINNQKVELPNALQDKHTLLFLAFTEKAQSQLEDWYGPVYTLFLDESGFNSMAYDCHVKVALMFTGAKAGIADKIIERIKKGVDPSFSRHLLFYEGNFSTEMAKLNIKKKTDGYVLVIDSNGQVIYKAKGDYSEAKLEKVADLLEL